MKDGIKVLVSALLTLGLCSAVQAEENDSLSSQARSMLKMLDQMKLPGGDEPAAATGALTTEAAQKQRAQMSQLLDVPTQGLLKSFKVSVEDEQIAGVLVKWLLPPQAAAAAKDSRIAVYIHGGGYVTGGPLDPTVVTLTQRTGLRTVSIDYRLAPEHPFPAGRDDCLAVYRELVRRFGAHNLVMYGGSAGGGMVLATVVAAKDAGLAMPASLALLSPWSDLTRTGDSYYANEGRDPILTWPGLQAAAEAYAAGKDPRQPGLSPLYADYDADFPPTLITTGTRDLFLSNCVRLYRTLRRAGVTADLQIWEGMWHSFEGFTSGMPESQEALALIAGHLTAPAAADTSQRARKL
jgi:epsilon-lactone hydrolase